MIKGIYSSARYREFQKTIRCMEKLLCTGRGEPDVAWDWLWSVTQHALAVRSTPLGIILHLTFRREEKCKAKVVIGKEATIILAGGGG